MGSPRRPGARYAPHTRLGLILENLLLGAPFGETAVDNPWEAWWISHRLAQPAIALGVDPRQAPGACAACREAAARLAAHRPPRHTDTLAAPPECGCLDRWCRAIRTPAEPPAWPRTRLSAALIKPGAPRAPITRELAAHYRILHQRPLHLGVADVRRLYPEAYGADFVAAVDDYLTSGPCDALVLLAADTAPEPRTVKSDIRQHLATDRIHNHLHMADNPGETFADLAHLVGPTVLTDLYERHERDLAPQRLEHYRTVLGSPSPRAGRLPSGAA